MTKCEPFSSVDKRREQVVVGGVWISKNNPDILSEQVEQINEEHNKAVREAVEEARKQWEKEMRDPKNWTISSQQTLPTEQEGK